MLPEPPAPSRSHPWTRLLVVFVVAFDVAAFWQWMGGAYQSEFGGHPDEGAHYVTGLHVTDFFRSGMKTSLTGSKTPETVHGDNDRTERPDTASRVIVETRPPGFAIVQSGWILAFGASRLSVLLLVAALAAGVATMLYRAVREEFGDWAAIAAALLWLCAASIREAYGLLMPEMLSALASFGGAIAWGRFLDLGRRRDALWYSFFAMVAAWTDGVGVAMLLMVLVSLLWTRLWFRLARWDVCLMGILPVISTLYFRKHAFDRFDFSPSSLIHAATFYAGKLSLVVGIAVALSAMAGIGFRCFSRSDRQGRWVAIASLVATVFAYCCVVSGQWQERYIVVSAPCLILLAMAGVKGISGLTSVRVSDATERQRRESLWVLLLVLLVLPFEVMKVRLKEFDGFGAIARTLIDEAPRDARILISSDATGEGMFLSELAMNNRRNGFTIEKGSTSLLADGENPSDTAIRRERFAEDRELLEYLTAGRIHYIVLDDSPTMKQRAGYHDQIRRVIEDNVRSFWPLHTNPITRDGEVPLRPIQIFRVLARS